MPIPPEFTYADEFEFTQKFVIPLIHQMGFSVVANYHGSSEFGKDLVFAEIDRFGHVRFHAIQVKYEASISLNESESLVLDCKQAYSNPFIHPQTGSTERISSFYAINGGSVSEQAVSHFFNSLVPMFGGNIRLLQAKDLLVLHNWATNKKHENLLQLLNGILLEVRFNRNQVAKMEKMAADLIAKGQRLGIIAFVKNDACAYFLTNPFIIEPNFISLVQDYWALVYSVKDFNLLMRSTRTSQEGDQKNLESIQKLLVLLNQKGEALEQVLTMVISSIVPSAV